MAENNKPATPVRPTAEEAVSCEICLKEIPVSEAASAEGADYFLYFCGAECFDRWKEQEKKAAPQASRKYSPFPQR